MDRQNNGFERAETAEKMPSRQRMKVMGRHASVEGRRDRRRDSQVSLSYQKLTSQETHR